MFLTSSVINDYFSNLFDTAIQFVIIGCSIVVCLQSLSSAINNHITATMDTGIHAAKQTASVGC